VRFAEGAQADRTDENDVVKSFVAIHLSCRFSQQAELLFAAEARVAKFDPVTC